MATENANYDRVRIYGHSLLLIAEGSSSVLCCQASHSKTPNAGCTTMPLRLGKLGSVQAIVALPSGDIEAGQEIVMDYGNNECKSFQS
jgi:hypothetical protein